MCIIYYVYLCDLKKIYIFFLLASEHSADDKKEEVFLLLKI